MVPAALVFYALMFGGALLWASLTTGSLFTAPGQIPGEGLRPLRDTGAGLLAAFFVIFISRELTRRTGWAAGLARALGELLGRLSLTECWLLAVASSLGEEALFRGALQPQVGLVAASLIFGLAHFVPRRDLMPWTLFSVAAGFLLGALFEATGNLIAPIVAHMVINGVNLRAITR